MAADFMAQRVQFLSSIFLIICLISGCDSTEKEFLGDQKVNGKEKSLKSVNGVVFQHNETFTGIIYTLYPDTQDTADITGYLNGREHGIWKKFYPNGKLQQQREFDQGKKTGVYVGWWENGNKKISYLFDNDEYNGLCKEWNAEGKLIKEMNYKNGYEDGPQKMFYDNGKVRSNYVIIKGRRYGLLGTKNCVNISDDVFKN